jgi:hypothetical protein
MTAGGGSGGDGGKACEPPSSARRGGSTRRATSAIFVRRRTKVVPLAGSEEVGWGFLSPERLMVGAGLWATVTGSAASAIPALGIATPDGIGAAGAMAGESGVAEVRGGDVAAGAEILRGAAMSEKARRTR